MSEPVKDSLKAIEADMREDARAIRLSCEHGMHMTPTPTLRGNLLDEVLTAYANRIENVNVREHGDLAALRFAVNAVVEAIAEPNEINSAIKLMAAEGMCRNALAAKPRNCDLYSSATAAWLDWSSKNILSGGTPTLDRFLVWLFARAQEGGGDGK